MEWSILSVPLGFSMMWGLPTIGIWRGVFYLKEIASTLKQELEILEEDMGEGD